MTGNHHLFVTLCGTLVKKFTRPGCKLWASQATPAKDKLCLLLAESGDTAWGNNCGRSTTCETLSRTKMNFMNCMWTSCQYIAVVSKTSSIKAGRTQPDWVLLGGKIGQKEERREAREGAQNATCFDHSPEFGFTSCTLCCTPKQHRSCHTLEIWNIGMYASNTQDRGKHLLNAGNAGVKAAAHSHLQKLPWRGPIWNLKIWFKTQNIEAETLWWTSPMSSHSSNSCRSLLSSENTQTGTELCEKRRNCKSQFQACNHSTILRSSARGSVKPGSLKDFWFMNSILRFWYSYLSFVFIEDIHPKLILRPTATLTEHRASTWTRLWTSDLLGSKPYASVCKTIQYFKHLQMKMKHAEAQFRPASSKAATVLWKSSGKVVTYKTDTSE